MTVALRTRRPRAKQVAATRAVVQWYLEQHFGRVSDPGVVEMFCDPVRVGAFAVDRSALRVGDGRALFRLLVATAMFQRRQDVQILRILQGDEPDDADEISDADRLLRLVDEGGCDHMRTTTALVEGCDLAKDPRTRLGCCNANAKLACHLKRHTVLLKRYGHFGKVPTSIALMVREAGVQDLPALRLKVMAAERDPLRRAQALEGELSRAWRVNQKIASMFLSMVTNPDLSRGLAPWSQGLDWTYYVVVDSNVDLFLASIRYDGNGTYDARRDFVRAIAQEIDLSELESTLHPFNPRLVQQAMYLFMSSANRRVAEGDCIQLRAFALQCVPSYPSYALSGAWLTYERGIVSCDICRKPLVPASCDRCLSERGLDGSTSFVSVDEDEEAHASSGPGYVKVRSGKRLTEATQIVEKDDVGF